VTFRHLLQEYLHLPIPEIDTSLVHICIYVYASSVYSYAYTGNAFPCKAVKLDMWRMCRKIVLKVHWHEFFDFRYIFFMKLLKTFMKILDYNLLSIVTDFGENFWSKWVRNFISALLQSYLVARFTYGIAFRHLSFVRHWLSILAATSFLADLWHLSK